MTGVAEATTYIKEDNMTLLPTAYAYSSSSMELFQSVASSTGQLVQDSFPLFEIIAVLLLCIWGITMIIKAATKGVRSL